MGLSASLWTPGGGAWTRLPAAQGLRRQLVPAARAGLWPCGTARVFPLGTGRGPFTFLRKL